MRKKDTLKKKIKIYSLILCLFGITTAFIPNALAANDDPIEAVNRLSDFIFLLTKAVGAIIAGTGIVQIGLSFTSHDASQRSNGFLYCVGGLIIMFSKTILNIISS